ACLTRTVAALFFSSRRRHTRFSRDWSSDVCSSDLEPTVQPVALFVVHLKIPPIGMYRGNHGTSGVQYQAEPTGEKIGLSHPKIRSEERRVGKECRSRWGRDAEIADGGKIARERVAG